MATRNQRERDRKGPGIRYSFQGMSLVTYFLQPGLTSHSFPVACSN
jgi:hypothetical protein